MILAAAGTLMAAAIALFFTYWAIYVALVRVVSLDFMFNRSMGFWGPMIGIGVLFLLQILIPRHRLENYSFEEGNSPFFASIAAASTGYGLLHLAAGPKTAVSFVKMFLSFLLIGPGLVFAAVRMGAKAYRLSRIDAARCAPVLATLYAAEGKVPYDELQTRHASLHPEEWLPALADIDGVMFRLSDPPGLSLSTELREELTAWRKQRRNNE
ncbi:MAG: hypothetical protein ACKV0T_05020 [Planctomycetales bacterium]